MLNVQKPVSAVTRCPHCSAKFRVRAEQVTLHSGLVRCGACRGIFDAVEHLVEGVLPQMPSMHETTEGASPQTIIQGMPAMTAESADSALNQPTASDKVASQTVASSTTASAMTASATITKSAPAGPTTTTRDAASRAKVAINNTPVIADPLVRNLDAAPPSTTPENPAHDLNDYRWRAPTQTTSSGARWAYAAASLIAALVLVGQGAYFFRDELVSRVPQAAPYFAMACVQIGCRVEPPKRADSLGFVGADLAADPAHKGLLIFTTILRNTGARTVAFPHLVLSLDGLGGDLVVRRVFSPTEFAPATANLAHGLDGGAEVEIKLYLDASQVNVVGFKVDHAYL